MRSIPRKPVGLWVVATLLATAFPVAAATAPDIHRSARNISVVGEGRATAPPDMATARIGVVAVAPTLAASNREASADMRRVTASLKANGVADRDIRTADFTVTPERQFQPSGEPGPITGYRVANQVEVKVRDLDKLGKVLEDAVAAGADDIQGITLSVENPALVQAQARAVAVSAAQAEASQLARLANVQLGAVLEISDASSEPIPLQFARAESFAAGKGVPIATGDLEFSAQVRMVFGIAGDAAPAATAAASP